MFTGLVESVGRIVDVLPGTGSTRITVAATLGDERTEPGASIAVDGVCLTVVSRDSETFSADVVAETLAVTTLGTAAVGRQVNLERSLRVGDPLGGHLVQGHVDTTAPVDAVSTAGGDWRVRFCLVERLRPYIAFKGSVAIDGVSLTVARADDRTFEVALVPTTLERTTLGGLEPGRQVNVEADLIARYLESLMRGRQQ